MDNEKPIVLNESLSFFWCSTEADLTALPMLPRVPSSQVTATAKAVGEDYYTDAEGKEFYKKWTRHDCQTIWLYWPDDTLAIAYLSNDRKELTLDEGRIIYGLSRDRRERTKAAAIDLSTLN